MKKTKIIPFLLLLLLDLGWIVFIFSRSAQSAEASSIESGQILALIKQLFPWVSMHFVRKLAHFTEFFILGCLVGATTLVGFRLHPLPPLSIGAVVAVSDELLQRSSPGRACRVSDMLLDFSGVVFAVALFYAIAWLIRRKKTSIKK